MGNRQVEVTERWVLHLASDGALDITREEVDARSGTVIGRRPGITVSRPGAEGKVSIAVGAGWLEQEVPTAEKDAGTPDEQRRRRAEATAARELGELAGELAPLLLEAVRQFLGRVEAWEEGRS